MYSAATNKLNTKNPTAFRFGAFIAISLLLLAACSKEPPTEASPESVAAPPKKPAKTWRG